MRVVAGKSRGLKLTSPPENVRPTLSRVKEAIFSSIGADLTGKTFLDAFCGTGQIGIEALSRGASFSTFIDIDITTAKKNLDKLKSNLIFAELNNFKLIKKDLRLNTEKINADIAYIDPPYDMNLDFLQFINVNNMLILEQDKNTDSSIINLPKNLELFKEKTYAHTKVYFFKIACSGAY